MNPFILRKKLRSHGNHAGTTPESLPLLASPQEIPQRQPEPESLYVKTRREAIGFGEELIQALLHSLRAGDLTDQEAIWELLPFLTGVVATAKVAQERTGPPSSTVTQGRAEPAVAEYLVSSLFLAQCHTYLTSQPGFEKLHLVTGQKVDTNRRTLDHMVKVALAEQSSVGALANDASLKSALLTMDQWGKAIYGLFHSHPGSGATHTRPSSTDLATHERYERGGFPLVGCIFVADGTLRFFSATTPFTITISGKGVTTINETEHVYKLQNSTARCVSDESLAAEEEG